jgi:hypothetical protein
LFCFVLFCFVLCFDWVSLSNLSRTNIVGYDFHCRLFANYA